MSCKNKKSAKDTAISLTAKKESSSHDSLRLSDKIKILYRYFRLNSEGKFYVKTAVDAAYLITG